jgi:hypothetical protein
VAKKEKPLGLTFHRTFALNRVALAQILPIAVRVRCDSNHDLPLDDFLRKHTSLGVEYIPAMRRYGVATGLLDGRDGVATNLGTLAVKHDRQLSLKKTQWLMHYHLSAPQGPGPLFWHGLVTRVLQPGRILNSRNVAQELALILREQNQKEPKPRALQSTATVFLGTYAKSDGLSALRVLEPTDGGYRVLRPKAPPFWVLAYTLADYWQYHWPDQVTVNLAELNKPGGWASLFWLDEDALWQQLQRLQQAGVLEVYRVAPPYQVVRLWRDKNAFLNQIYEQRSGEDD